MSRDEGHRERRADQKRNERDKAERDKPTSPRDHKDKERGDRDRDRASTTSEHHRERDEKESHKDYRDSKERDEGRRTDRDRERDRDRDRERLSERDLTASGGRKDSGKSISSGMSMREMEKALKEATARESRVRAQLKVERAEKSELEERLEEAMARVESLTEKLRRARDLIAQSAGSTSRDEVTKAQLNELQRRNEELMKELSEWKERTTVAEETGGALLGRALKAEQKQRDAEEQVRRRGSSAGSAGSHVSSGRNIGQGSDKGDKPLPPLPTSVTPDGAVSALVTATLPTPMAGTHSHNNSSSNQGSSSSKDSPPPMSPSTSSVPVTPPHNGDTGARQLVPRTGPYGSSDEGRNEGTEMLLHLILSPSFALVDALLSCTPATESDRAVRALLAVVSAKDRATEMALHVVSSEVAATPEENYSTFLRANSWATKIGVAYLRRAAAPWINAALKAPLEAMIKNPMPVEVDAHKEGMTPTLVASNAKNLRVLTKCFLDSLYTVMDSAPPCITLIASTLRDLVERKFPGKGTTALGAFFFLRIICPAICAPEAWGLLPADRLQGDNRRALVLVTKVLQSMANEVELGRKEDYMSVMNDFLLAQQPGLAAFLNTLASPAAKPSADAVREVSDEELWMAVYDLHSQLISVQAKVEATLDMESEVAALDLAIDKLGQPLKPPQYRRA